MTEGNGCVRRSTGRCRVTDLQERLRWHCDRRKWCLCVHIPTRWPVLDKANGRCNQQPFICPPGTYSDASLTELLLSYLAGQLGTTPDGLQAGISSNASFQAALTDSIVVANAENATTLPRQYALVTARASQRIRQCERTPSATSSRQTKNRLNNVARCGR